MGCLAKSSILTLAPLVRSDVGLAVEEEVRVVLGLDLTQGIIIDAVEGLLEVWLAEVTL